MATIKQIEKKLETYERMPAYTRQMAGVSLSKWAIEDVKEIAREHRTSVSKVLGAIIELGLPKEW